MFFRGKKAITGLLLGAVLLSTVFLVPTKKAEAQLLIPFGGKLEYMDWSTCTCGFVIFYVYDVTKRTTYRIIGPWPGLDTLFRKIIKSLLGVKLPPVYYEHLYINGKPGIFYAYQQNVIGNFFPQPGATCWTLCQFGCCPRSGAGDGWLTGIGSSVLPSSY